MIAYMIICGYNQVRYSKAKRNEDIMPFTQSELPITDPKKLASQRWENKQKHYSLRLTPEIWERIIKKTSESGSSVNSYVIGLITKDLEQ